MTLFTPNFGLPYPDALDEPCDFAQDWCAFTDAVNVAATRFENTVNRTVPVIPMARMTLTSSVTIVNTSLIPFDSVSVNTAGWIDFDASNTDIVPDRAGFFVLSANALVQTTGILGAVITLQFDDLSAIQDNQIDRFSSGIGLTLAKIQQITTPGPLNVRLQTTGGGNVTIGKASFSVWWHADTATP
jgi:hypothetical protein